MDVCEVDLWTIALTTPRPVVLSEDEAARASRFRFEEDRIRWTRARSSLRTILSRYAGEAPLSICFNYGPHGKPELLFADIQFNLSHAGDYALIAITRSVSVGVDIERLRPKIDIAALLRRLGETSLPDSIPELYQAWCRREAKSKAAGGALFDRPKTDAVAADLTAPDGYAAALALIGCTPVVNYCSHP